MPMATSPDDDMPSERHFIDAALDGDHRSFLHLVRRHQNRVYRFLLKHINHVADAEDLAQDTFIEAYLNLANFRGDSTLATWLLGIALNKARNYLNRAPERRFHWESDDSLFNHASPNSMPCLDFEKRQVLDTVRQGIAQLPTDLREALIFVSFEQLSYQDTANMLGIPVGTAKSRVNRARCLLADYLQVQGLTPSDAVLPTIAASGSC